MKRCVLIAFLVGLLAGGALAGPTTRPARVTVKIDGLRIVDAVDAFARQTGIAFEYAEPKPSDKTVSLDLTDTPVMDAIDAFLQAAACRPVVYGADRRVPLHDAAPAPMLRPADDIRVRIDAVRVSGRAPVRGTTKYEYTIDLTVLFDPARGVLAVETPMRIEEAASAGEDFNAGPEQPAELQRVDGRPLGVFPLQGRLTSDRRIERFDLIRLRLRVWRAARRETVTLDVDGLRDGGRVEADGFVVTAGPMPDPTDKTPWLLTVNGPLIERHKAGPWAPALVGGVDVFGTAGLLPTKCKFVSRGGDAIEFQVGGSDLFAERQKRAALPPPPTHLTIAVPTHVKSEDVVLELKNLSVP